MRSMGVNRPRSCRDILLAAAGAAIAAACASVVEAGHSPGGDGAAPVDVDAIMQELVHEAQRIERDEAARVPDSPDFVERWADHWAEQRSEHQTGSETGEEGGDDVTRLLEAIDREELGRRVLEPVHEHAFIDAYVRWQLTGFEPRLPDLDDDRWPRVLAAGPRFQENPSADRRLMSTFEQAADAGSLSTSDQEWLGDLESDRMQRMTRIEMLNQPAEDLWRWVGEQIEDDHFRSISWLLAECAETIEAGWSTRSVKTRITRGTRDAGNADVLSPEERAQLERWMRDMAGMERSFVRDVTFLASGEVNVRFSTGAVRRRDVENWRASLRGEERGDEP